MTAQPNSNITQKQQVRLYDWSIQCLGIWEFRNRLFVLSFKNSDNDSTRSSFDEYYMSLIEIKDFSALIDSKLFFDQPEEKQTSIWKTCWNVKKWLHSRKLIRLLILPTPL